MKITLEQLEGASFEARRDDGASIRMEGPPDLGGKGEALRPMETLLAALAGCSAVDVVKILSQQREPLAGLRIEVEGKRADAVPAVFTDIHLRFVIRGPVADNKARRAVDLSVDKYCSVARMLQPSTRITHEVALEPLTSDNLPLPVADPSRPRPPLRVLWSQGNGPPQAATLHQASASGAILHGSAAARAGDEIRLVVDPSGQDAVVALARVLSADDQQMKVTFLSLGIDPQAAAMLAERTGQAAPARAPASARGAPASQPPPPAQPSRPSQPPPSQPTSQPSQPALTRPRGTIIGIDLGTTNTCAAYVVDGRPRIIPGRTGTSTIPSMITFDPDGSWHVGQRAADRQILHPLRTVYGSKRLVGRTYRPELAAQLQQHFAYPLGEADGHRFGVRIDQRVVSMDTVAARVLDEVRATAEAHLKGPVEAAVITVPAYFTEVQREAVRRAAREANLAVQRIVNEPTAAAVAYGHKQQPGKRTRVAVYDFGGGTFDFSIVDVADGRFEVLTTGGDNFVGGSDFDDLVASHLLAEFQQARGVTADPNPQQIARLRGAAEDAKRALSEQTEYLVELPAFAQGRVLSVELTRERFEQIVAPLIHRTMAITREVMADLNLVPSDIDDVLLVGGTTRVPAVERAVAEFFQRRPSKGINPDEAVALGAALLADELGPKGPALLDILPMTIGYGTTGVGFVPIVPRNTRLPAQREVTLDADLLGTVTMAIFQGESPDASRNEYLFSVLVEDRSLWDKGRVTLQLSFDERCVLTVDARDARDGQPLPIRLDRSRSVDEVLRELGHYEGPAVTEAWHRPPSRLGQALGKLFGRWGRLGPGANETLHAAAHPVEQS